MCQALLYGNFSLSKTAKDFVVSTGFSAFGHWFDDYSSLENIDKRVRKQMGRNAQESTVTSESGILTILQKYQQRLANDPTNQQLVDRCMHLLRRYDLVRTITKNSALVEDLVKGGKDLAKGIYDYVKEVTGSGTKTIEEEVC